MYHRRCARHKCLSDFPDPVDHTGVNFSNRRMGTVKYIVYSDESFLLVTVFL